ncbi:hypothetical protein C8R43DRAFT_215969 [Mycena crocata]|nr:hypothetical protein C8R43DRAFT_215969 [Mycena crocata]
MFGSLVIVFPTFHIGGALHLRYGDKEEIFDSSQTLSPFDTPKLAYAAFYGDVENDTKSPPLNPGTVSLSHTTCISPMAHGHLALTPLQPAEDSKPLSELLEDPDFLPEGGLLGFGLRYAYPVNSHTSLVHMKPLLKGADALLIQVCEELQPGTSLKAVYSADDGNGGEAMMDEIADLGSEMQVECSVIILLEEEYGASLPDDGGSREITDITWITSMSGLNDLRSPYFTYGNGLYLRRPGSRGGC